MSHRLLFIHQLIEPIIRPPADEKGPSKNELKKKQKAEEKAKKAADKAARLEELSKQKEAADVVSEPTPLKSITGLIDFYRILHRKIMANFPYINPSRDPIALVLR